jgi:hypothetical protein
VISLFSGGVGCGMWGEGGDIVREPSIGREDLGGRTSQEGVWLERVRERE